MKQSLSFDREAADHLTAIIAADKIQESCDLLGEGLSGKVYEFENYAVKVFKENCSENNDFVMLSLLRDHPAFPTLHFKDQKFMVVEKVKGYTLGEIRKAGDQLGDQYFEQIEKIVEDCYKEGIIPGDLHLNNIMIDHDKKVKIIDVGRFFCTSQKESFKESIEEDLERLYCFFNFFSSSRKKHRRRWKHSRSRSHSHSYSSRSSSRRRHRRKRRYHSYSSS